MPRRIRKIGELLGFFGEEKSAKIIPPEPKVEEPEETSQIGFRAALRTRLSYFRLGKRRTKKEERKKGPRKKSKEPGVGENIDIDS